MTQVNYEQHSGVKANQGKMPEHVAIVMDGNGRWATRQGLSRSKGHLKGKESVREIVKACLHRKIQVLTLFTFGKENWKRPSREVRYLFRLLYVVLRRDISTLHEQGVCLKVHGDKLDIPTELIKTIEVAEQTTQNNTKLHLNIMFNYSGRWDIRQAIQQSCALDDAPWEQFSHHLSLASYPEPDLFIRTAGVQRISNFMLWELAYSEFYFTESCWPEFDSVEFDKALSFYQAQERRFGLTSSQVETIHA